MTDKDILSVFRKCFPRGLAIRDEDILYFAHKLLEQYEKETNRMA